MSHPCKSQSIHCLTHTLHCQSRQSSPGEIFTTFLIDEIFPQIYPCPKSPPPCRTSLQRAPLPWPRLVRGTPDGCGFPAPVPSADIPLLHICAPITAVRRVYTQRGTIYIYTPDSPPPPPLICQEILSSTWCYSDSSQFL